MNKNILSPLLLSVLLQACGGSSTPDTPKEPVEPVKYTFTFNAQLTNDCGISTPFTEVDLLLQDSNWETIESYKTDDNGLISFITESEFINYTLVAKNQKGSESQGLNVVSFNQASSSTPAHYQAQFDESLDNTSCECVTQNLELSHRTFATQTSVVSSLGDLSWTAVDSKTTLVEDVKVCKALDGEWPLHSFSVLGTDVKENAIVAGGFKSDYSANADELWLLAADEVADEVTLTMPHQAFTTSQLIGSIKHFPASVATEDDNILIFDTHNYISETTYQSQASVTFTESSSIFGSAVIKTHHQVVSTDAQTSFNVRAAVTKPPIDDINYSEIKGDGSYDYSAVPGFPMAVISFTFTTYDPITKLLMPAKWTFYGPKSGTLAISGPLTGYDDIIDIETDKKSTDVRLIQSTLTSNYQDYIKYYQSENSLNMASDLLNNFHEVEISISLN